MEFKTLIDADTFVENLRISIEEDWNVERFSKILNSINILYCITSLTYFQENEFLEATGFQDKEEFAKKFLSKYEVFSGETYKKETSQFIQYFKGTNSRYALSQNLLVDAIIYNSPGKIDLFGIGKVIEELSKLLRYYFPSKRDRILNAQEEQKLFDMRIESLKNLQLSPEEIKKIILLEQNAKKLISNVIDKNLISNIELIEKE